jgi:predicted RNA binding protein YcfA (HicA-like mRNA interferase family)
LPRLTSEDANRLLLVNGFVLLRVKESHRIYGKAHVRVVVPHHPGQVLHPKIVRQVLKAIADSAQPEQPLAS